MTEVTLPNFFYLLKEVLDVGLFCTTVDGTLLDANWTASRMMGFEERDSGVGGWRSLNATPTPSNEGRSSRS